jgi:hypothetical protein
MEKKMILLTFITMILIGLGVVIFLAWQTNNRIKINKITPQEIKKTNISNISPSITGQIQIALNENGYPLYLIDGIIDKISSIDPMKLDVKIRINKIFPDQNEKEVVKTIIVKNDTEFVLHNLTTKKGNSMESSSLKAGDSVAIWTVEPNTDILKLDQFTATKIIKFQ